MANHVCPQFGQLDLTRPREGRKKEKCAGRNKKRKIVGPLHLKIGLAKTKMANMGLAKVGPFARDGWLDELVSSGSSNHRGSPTNQSLDECHDVAKRLEGEE